MAAPAWEADRQFAARVYIAKENIGHGIAAFGAAITAGMVSMPELVGYVLIGVGAIDALVMPMVLARSWKTPS